MVKLPKQFEYIELKRDKKKTWKKQERKNIKQQKLFLYFLKIVE